MDQRLRKEMEERALKEGRIAIKEKGKWGLKCIFNSKCKSIDVGTGYCNIHYRENEKAMQKTEMLAIATRTSRTAVLGDDGLHYTLKCTDASCNLGVPYFNHSVASNAPKLCQTHQKEEDRKQHLKTQKESMVALATQKPGRTAVLYKNVQGLDFWSLNCTKEGCDLGVGEYINSWRCPAFCHTHQAEENRRMELQRQKSVVDSIVSRLSTGRKAVLMKPANSENEYWTLACQKEGCEAGVGRNLSTYDIPSHCIPHKIEASLARRKVELDQRAKNEGRTVISTKDGDWVLKCIKDECNEPEYGDTKRCSKHYSSEKFQVAEEKMSDVLTKAL